MDSSSVARDRRDRGSGGVLLLGSGNVLMGDDAFGPYLVRSIEAAYSFDSGLRLIDGGTPGSDLTSLIGHADALIMVDTIAADGPPGELRLYRGDQLLERAIRPRTATHQPALYETLLTLELHGRAPNHVLLIAVIPLVVAPRTCLSPAVKAALLPAEFEVLRELIRLGQRPSLRWPPGQLDIWWERRPARHIRPQPHRLSS